MTCERVVTVRWRWPGETGELVHRFEDAGAAPLVLGRAHPSFRRTGAGRDARVGRRQLVIRMRAATDEELASGEAGVGVVEVTREGVNPCSVVRAASRASEPLPQLRPVRVRDGDTLHLILSEWPLRVTLEGTPAAGAVEPATVVTQPVSLSSDLPPSPSPPPPPFPAPHVALVMPTTTTTTGTTRTTGDKNEAPASTHSPESRRRHTGWSTGDEDTDQSDVNLSDESDLIGETDRRAFARAQRLADKPPAPEPQATSKPARRRPAKKAKVHVEESGSGEDHPSPSPKRGRGRGRGRGRAQRKAISAFDMPRLASRVRKAQPLLFEDDDE